MNFVNLYSTSLVKTIMLFSRASFSYLGRRAMSGQASKSPLYRLRQKTGLAYTLCREALDKHDNNVEEAEAWLKAQALAHGLQKATKVGGRSTREGLISIAVQKSNSLISVVELNCETDFVARNHVFRDFVTELTEQVYAMPEECSKFKIPGSEFLEGLKLNDANTKKLEDQIAPLIVKLGENIKLTKALSFRSLDATNIKLYGQIHAQAVEKDTQHCKISVGRFGSTVALRKLDSCLDDESLKVHGNRLCRHVIGFNPTYIELPENIRKNLEEAEKRILEKKQEDINDGDDEYSDQENSTAYKSNRDDWPSIMDQTLIMSEEVSVREFCQRIGASIVHFNRFECGVDS